MSKAVRWMTGASQAQVAIGRKAGSRCLGRGRQQNSIVPKAFGISCSDRRVDRLSLIICRATERVGLINERRLLFTGLTLLRCLAIAKCASLAASHWVGRGGSDCG